MEMTVEIITPNGTKENQTDPHEYYKDAYTIINYDIMISHIYMWQELACYYVPNLNMNKFGYSFRHRPYDAIEAIRDGYANNIIEDKLIKTINSEDCDSSKLAELVKQPILHTHYIVCYIGGVEYVYVNWSHEGTGSCNVFIPTSQLERYHYNLITNMSCAAFYDLVQSQDPVTFALDLPGAKGDFSGVVWLESWHNISYFFGQMLIVVDGNWEKAIINPFQSCEDQIARIIERGGVSEDRY